MHAYAHYKGTRGLPPHLATFHEKRYRLYCDLVGIDPDNSEHADPRAMRSRDMLLMDKHVMHRHVLAAIATEYRTLSAPWAGLTFGPKPVGAVIRRYDESVRDLILRQQEIYLDAMVDAAEFIWGPCPRAVSDEELEQHKVSAEHHPPLADYL